MGLISAAVTVTAAPQGYNAINITLFSELVKRCVQKNGVLQNLMFCGTPFSAKNKSFCKALHGKKVHCSKLMFEHRICVLIVAASVARRREGARGIFFPRGGTLWCKSNPFAVTKGGKG